MAKPKPRPKKKPAPPEPGPLDMTIEGWRTIGKGAVKGVDAVKGGISWIRKKNQ
jgi:hypothetical protein